MAFFLKYSPTLLALFIFFFLITEPILVFAQIGVGIGRGEIQFEQPLLAGGIYDLPPIPVINTGQRPAKYEISIQYHQDQEKREDLGLKPPPNWFSFEPRVFHLDPGQSQMVKIVLTLPLKTQPGRYFVYLEAHPTITSENDLTQINIAAATKLYFTVAPSNLSQAIYYRLLSLTKRYYPWPGLVLILIIAAFTLRFFFKTFSLRKSKLSRNGMPLIS